MTPEQRALRDSLAGIPARARAALAGIASPDRSAAPNIWSAREVCLHLAAVEHEVWQPRLEALATTTRPHWPWTEPGLWAGPGDATAGGALAEFAAARAETVARIDALDDEGWRRSGVHETYGELDVAGLMRVALDHDEEHLSALAGQSSPRGRSATD